MSRTDEDKNENSYWCFISYTHADNRAVDRKWATWLHQSIETYEIPSDLVGTPNRRGELIPTRIFPVFRDEEELAAGPLPQQITDALERSRTLIVICSPRVVASRYVTEEITAFQDLGRGERIFRALVDGDPRDTAKDADRCIPHALRHGRRANGEIDKSKILEEQLATDFRTSEESQGWTSAAAYQMHLKENGTAANLQQALVKDYELSLHNAKIKLIAGILSVELAELKERDKAFQLELNRQRTKALRSWLVAVALLGLLALGAGLIAWSQRNRAIRQAHISEIRRILSESRSNVAADPALAALLAAEAQLRANGLGIDSEPILEALHSSLGQLGGYTVLPQAGYNQTKMSPDGSRLIAASNGELFLWKLDKYNPDRPDLRQKISHTDFLALDVYDEWMVSLAQDGKLSLWTRADLTSPVEYFLPKGFSEVHALTSLDLVAVSGRGQDTVFLRLQESRLQEIGRLEAVEPVWWHQHEDATWTVVGRNGAGGGALYTVSSQGPSRVSVLGDPSAKLDRAVLSKDARWLATVSGGIVSTWQVHSHQESGLRLELRGELKTPGNKTPKLAFDDSSARIVLCSGSLLMIAELAGEALVWQDIPKPTSAVVEHAFFWSRGVCAFTEEGDALYWEEGKKLSAAPTNFRRLHSGSILDWESYNGVLYTAGDDGRIAAWQPASDEYSVLTGHTKGVNGLRVAYPWLLSQGEVPRLWNLDSLDSWRTQIRVGLSQVVWSATSSPDGSLICLGTGKAGFEIWRTEPLKRLGTFDPGEGPGTRPSLFSEDGKYLAIGKQNGEILIADAESATVLTESESHNGNVRKLALADNLLYSGGEDGVVRVTPLNDAVQSQELWKQNEFAQVLSLKLSRDKRWLASGGALGKIVLMDRIQASPPLTHQVEAERGIQSLAFSRDGKVLAASPSASYGIHLFFPDSQTLEPFRTLQTDSMIVWDMAFDPKGRLYAAGTGGIESWDGLGRDETPKKSYLRGHKKEQVRQLLITPEGDSLISAGESGTVVHWDLRSPTPSKTSSQLAAHSGRIMQLALAGQYLVSGSSEDFARMIKIAPGALLEEVRLAAGANLTTKEWQRYFPDEQYRATYPESLRVRKDPQ